MLFGNIIALGFYILGIIFLLKLTPEQIAKDIDELMYAPKTLKYSIEVAKGERKISKLQKIFADVKMSLKITKREDEFSKVCVATFILFFMGIVLSITIDNLLLLPILSTVMAALPYLYLRRIVKDFNKRIKDELETALSIITSSYIRTEDIVTSINENIPNIKQPVKEVFKEFLGQTMLINSNIVLALEMLKNKIDNGVFHEWCDTVIACQQDRTLKDTLQTIADKFTDIRIVNAKLENLVMNPRKDYYSVLALTFLNFPLIWLLNKDWFAILTDTIVTI